jgi:glycosyltransferase involved in cell wall biosynthesis
VGRRALKDLSFFLPFRGFLRFVYMYFFRLGILDALAGLHYALMISMYEYWIEVKIRERRFDWKTRTQRTVQLLLDDPADPAPNPAFPTGPDGSPLVEIMIPTFNEASHIREAVENARRLGPVFVLDSFSTDGTQDLARQAGATVVEHVFENYSGQKNWGLDNLPFRGSWVFILDADERITPALRDEIRQAVARPDGTVGYFVNRIVIFMGQQIRHGGLFPSWNLRLFRRGSCRYEDRSVHEHMLATGPTAYLDQLMLHIRRETITQYIAKHIRYADMESNEWLKARMGQGGGAKAQYLFRDVLRWRQWLRRSVWPSLPFKPLIRFVYMYLFRLGFLDGVPGWHLACLMANYEHMITLLYKDKIQQTRRRAARTPRAT